MDFQVKMVVKPGDTHVSKATVEVFDAKAASHTKQVILEGETVETMLNVPPGGRIEIKELERPLVYDQEQKAAVPMDLTPEDKLTDPNRPKPGTPLPGVPQAEGKTAPPPPGKPPSPPFGGPTGNAKK